MRDNEIAAGAVVLLSDGKDIGSTTSRATVTNDLAKNTFGCLGRLRSPQYDASDAPTGRGSTGGKYTEPRRQTL